MRPEVIERNSEGPEDQWVRICGDRTYWVRISHVRTIDPTVDEGDETDEETWS